MQRRKKVMMRQLFSAIVVLGFLLHGVCSADDNVKLKDEKERISYSAGYRLGSDFKQQFGAVDARAMVKGLQDALLGAKPLMTSQEMQTTLMGLKRQFAAEKQKERQELAAKYRVEGQAFLAENAKKEGVVSLPSGLQYKVIKEGTGKAPGLKDTVSVNYRGTLIDGTEFDNSYLRNAPATFRVDSVIRGWTEALQLMKEGAKWELYIPAELAYGERGAGSKIPPNSPLIFEVEVISVTPGKETVKKTE
jgi:FKBP-type peptidyl-prolyl cis-trans isomerase FklB